ncbi:MAG: 16S rRNA processing protein RimM [Desulfamplus sp.]|nr:16S rRNA processing protein RimM [Desulfamplus sp.]
MDQTPRGIAGRYIAGHGSTTRHNIDRLDRHNIDRNLIVIGEVTGVHGVRGYVKIRSFAESSDLFSPGIRFFLSRSSGDLAASGNLAASDNSEKWYNVVSATPHKKGIIALFEGVTRDIAEGLVGKNVCVARDDLPDLETDTYYWEDLIGLKVTDIHSGYLGVIDYVMPTGSNDVFVVKADGSEILVPALEWVVLSVDLDNGQMTVDLPDGLRD